MIDDFANKIILIAPLDWELGHATRVVPIINKLKDKNKIILAANNLSYQFLKKEFPNLKIIKFPSFKIKYSKRAKLQDFLQNMDVCKYLTHFSYLSQK